MFYTEPDEAEHNGFPFPHDIIPSLLLMTGQMALSLRGHAQKADVFEQIICMYDKRLMNQKDPLSQHHVVRHSELKLAGCFAFAPVTSLLMFLGSD